MGGKFERISPLYKYEDEIKKLYLEKKDKIAVARIIINKYKIKINPETGRHIIARIVKEFDNKNVELVNENTKDKKVWDEQKDKASFEFNGVNKNINNLEEALIFSKVDLTIWEVERHIFNSWEVTMKGNDGKPIKATNIQVKIWFAKIKIEDKIKWENFIEEIKSYSPKYSELKHKKVSKDCLYEISLPDLHIGKMGWNKESGEDYDTKEAIKRYNTAFDELLTRINLNSIERFLLPIGNDMINIDNSNGTTTAGTPQNCDSRWQQMFIKAKDLLISNIDKISKIAPVHIIVISGNHDFSTMLYLGEVLNAWYRNSKNVFIDNNPKQRKYYEFGENLLAFTHGNEEKHQDLGLIVASEEKEMWARTSFREIHLGHFHKTKTTKYIETDEYQGFRVRILPSLSGTDAWHNSKGYMSTKAAEGFLYHKKQGLITTTRFNLK